MRIGELAKRASMATSRIRFYEARGLLPVPARTDNGYRDYPEALIEVLQFIEQAQRLGFSLKELTGRTDLDTHTCPDVAAALRAKLAEVDAHIAAAMARREALTALITEIENRDREAA